SGTARRTTTFPSMIRPGGPTTTRRCSAKLTPSDPDRRTGWLLRLEPLNRPSRLTDTGPRVGTAIPDAIVQPVRTPLPELELFGNQPVPAPEVGNRNLGVVWVLLS